MLALALLAIVPILMWIGQSILLKRAGLPIRRRIDSRGAPRSVRTMGRAITQVSLILVILAYPMLRGESPLSYYGSLFPQTRSAIQLPHGAAAAILFLCALFAAWIATDRIRVVVHQSRKRWIRRLVLLLPTAMFGATVEELLFRGVILSDLMRSLPDLTTVAVILGSLVFAGAHYVRSVKRHWTFGGHLMLGILLCVAFVETETLWLPIGLHAGGILMIMGARPFFRYRGPAWITGASIFPFAGVAGVAGLIILTLFVATYYGAN